MTHPSADYDSLPARQVTVDQVVAINVEHWRRLARMTQDDLASAIGWNSKNLSNALRSRRPGAAPRRFDAQALASLCFALRIPLAALFLPPPDDGVTFRYAFSGGTEPLDMAFLASIAVPDPPDTADGPLAAAYEQRYASVLRSYLGMADDDMQPSAAEIATTQARQETLARLERQRATLADIMGDIDRRVQAIADAGGAS